MNRVLTGTGAVCGVACVAFLARRWTSRHGGLDVGQLIERMPDNAPPKWMFHNIGAIRENTERILRLLESQQSPAGAKPVPAPA